MLRWLRHTVGWGNSCFFFFCWRVLHLLPFVLSRRTSGRWVNTPLRIGWGVRLLNTKGMMNVTRVKRKKREVLPQPTVWRSHRNILRLLYTDSLDIFYSIFRILCVLKSTIFVLMDLLANLHTFNTFIYWVVDKDMSSLNVSLI